MNGIALAVLVSLSATLAQRQVTADPPAALPRETQQAQSDVWLGADKFRHFWMSYAVTAGSFATARAFGQSTEASLGIGVAAAAAAGIGKELYDRGRGGRFSIRDLVADALGISAAYFLLREVR